MKDSQDLKGFKLLFIDDEKVFCQCAQGFLELRGCRVTTAHDVETALDLLQSGEFDAVVSDICLPKISGISLLKTLRARGSLVPVVMMSGYADTRVAVECLQAGAADFLFKPYRMEVLETVLSEIRVKNRRLEAAGIIINPKGVRS